MKKEKFTLIELIVVISIISILAGLILGGVSAGIDKARKNTAQSEIRDIVLGITGFEKEYAYLPIVNNDTKKIQLWLLLTGKKGDGSIAPYNSKHITFINTTIITDDKDDEYGKLKDPWGNEYEVRTELSGTVATIANTTSNPAINIAVASKGADGVMGTRDDIYSWSK